jgi:FtsZ-binding cell division protein ZapB
MLKMTDEQRYSAVLKELGEVLQEKNTTISCLRWQIDELKAKLAEAAKERDFAKEKLADASIAIDLLQAEVKELKGGAA